MKTIDPATMTRDELKAELDHACRQNDAARSLAGIASHAERRRLLSIARQHAQNITALANALYGPADLSLTDGELLAALAE